MSGEIATATGTPAPCSAPVASSRAQAIFSVIDALLPISARSSLIIRGGSTLGVAIQALIDTLQPHLLGLTPPQEQLVAGIAVTLITWLAYEVNHSRFIAKTQEQAVEAHTP